MATSLSTDPKAVRARLRYKLTKLRKDRKLFLSRFKADESVIRVYSAEEERLVHAIDAQTRLMT